MRMEEALLVQDGRMGVVILTLEPDDGPVVEVHHSSLLGRSRVLG